MKKLFIVVCLGMLVFACCSIHKCNSNDIEMETKGISENLLLSETESAYLNRIFETTRKDFDFVNKKIGFLTGSSGTKTSSKDSYFDMQKKHSVDANYPCDNGTLYIFNTTQKEESGGYDAAIVYWSKFSLPIEDVVKRLKKH